MTACKWCDRTTGHEARCAWFIEHEAREVAWHEAGMNVHARVMAELQRGCQANRDYIAAMEAAR